jgi:hypothetical protein
MAMNSDRRIPPFFQFSLRQLVIMVVVAGILLGVLVRMEQQNAVLHCSNQCAFLYMDLMAGEPSALPYLDGAPGYEMLARLSVACVPHRGTTNCPHGAPGAGWGGWQAVNLSPEQWKELARRWQAEGGKEEIPFCWCGRPTGDRRIGLSTPDGVRLSPNSIWDEDKLVRLLDRLNAHVKAMGIPPVSLNVPDDVNWSKFEKP